jgi:hypothetical protein
MRTFLVELLHPKVLLAHNDPYMRRMLGIATIVGLALSIWLAVEVTSTTADTQWRWLQINSAVRSRSLPVWRHVMADNPILIWQVALVSFLLQSGVSYVFLCSIVHLQRSLP